MPQKDGHGFAGLSEQGAGGYACNAPPLLLLDEHQTLASILLNRTPRASCNAAFSDGTADGFGKNIGTVNVTNATVEIDLDLGISVNQIPESPHLQGRSVGCIDSGCVGVCPT